MSLPRFFVSIVVIITTFMVEATFAQSSPNKPIRMVTSSAGGGVDFAARVIAQGLTSTAGQPAFVDNQGGGVVPPLVVSKAAPDGYTLLVFSGIFWTAPLLEKTPYDPVKDFAPVTLAARMPNILVVHPSLPVNSVKELIALAKSRPGALNYGSGPSGSTLHLTAELFKSMTGVNMTRIPYKSEGPALNDLLGGQVQVMFNTASGGLPLVKAKRLRALAVTTAKPSALVPGLPTINESGVPGYESESIIGIYSPTGTPQPVLDRLNQEFVKVLNVPEIKEKLFNSSLEVIASSRAQSSATMKSEIARLSKLIQDAGIKAD